MNMHVITIIINLHSLQNVRDQEVTIAITQEKNRHKDNLE